METRVNYVVVGLFALLLSAAFISAVLWLSADKRYGLPYDTYVADMQESVSGLNLNAPVKYRGVEVGQVRKITLNKANLELVRVELAIERGIPIKQDTIATLKSQGLTGIAFIELSGGSSASPLLVKGSDDPYPVIKTGASLMGRLDSAMSGLLGNLNKTAENINALLDDENRKTLKRALADVATMTSVLAAHKADLDKTLSNTAVAMESVGKISAQMPPLIERISRTTETIEKMAKETSHASASVRKTLDDGTPELERMLVTMRDTLVSLQRVTEQIEQNPGVLLRGKESRLAGPGE